MKAFWVLVRVGVVVWWVALGCFGLLASRGLARQVAAAKEEAVILAEAASREAGNLRQQFHTAQAEVTALATTLAERQGQLAAAVAKAVDAEEAAANASSEAAALRGRLLIATERLEALAAAAAAALQ